jgi:hypothetical protein
MSPNTTPAQITTLPARAPSRVLREPSLSDALTFEYLDVSERAPIWSPLPPDHHIWYATNRWHPQF